MVRKTFFFHLTCIENIIGTLRYHNYFTKHHKSLRVSSEGTDTENKLPPPRPPARRGIEPLNSTSPVEPKFRCRQWAMLQGVCVCGWRLFSSTSVPPKAGQFVFILSQEARWTCIHIHFTIHTSNAATICILRHTPVPQRPTVYFTPLHLKGFRRMDFPLLRSESFIFAIVLKNLLKRLSALRSSLLTVYISNLLIFFIPLKFWNDML